MGNYKITQGNAGLTSFGSSPPLPSLLLYPDNGIQSVYRPEGGLSEGINSQRSEYVPAFGWSLSVQKMM